jgi:hypothetical protein
MTGGGNELDAARRRLGLSHYDLWLSYIAVGGIRDAHGVRSYLTGRDTCSDADHDHLAIALNEALIDAGDPQRIAYRHA